MLDQYESLRKTATDGRALSQAGYGLALSLSRGMTDWLLAMRQLPPLPLATVSPQGGVFLPDLAAAAKMDLTLLLADMVLACQMETRQ